MRILILCSLFLITTITFAQVGVGTTTPLSTLDINGNLSLKVVSYNGGPSGSATVISDGIYLNLTPRSSGRVEFLLPNAALFPGRIYIVRNINDNFTAQIYSAGGAFFPGDGRIATAAPVNMLPDSGGIGGIFTKTLIFVSDGINWTYGRLSR